MDLPFRRRRCEEHHCGAQVNCGVLRFEVKIVDFPVRSVISSYGRQGLGRAAAWTFAGPNGLRSSSTDAPGEEWGLDGAEPGPGEVPGAEIAARAQVQPGRRRDGDPPALAVDWQEYAAAIERREAILGRAAPRPVRPARVTRRRIRACAAANGTDGWAAAEMVRRGWWAPS